LFDQLVKKVESFHIKHTVRNRITIPGIKIIDIEIPKGRDSETISLSSRTEELSEILESNFYEYKFIKGFEAIWSEKYKRIECELECLASNYIDIVTTISKIIENKKSIEIKDQEENDFDEENILEDKVKEYRIKVLSVKNIDLYIGGVSQEFAILSGIKSTTMSIDLMKRARKTIQIENIDVTNHDEALAYLLKLSNSLLFQINNLVTLPVTMRFERENRRNRFHAREDHRKNDKKYGETKLSDLKYEYDNDPMSLYLHAKNSIHSPINQFLSYYQCIEYYFPVYANIEAKKQIQRILKDPLFNPNADHNIAKILSVIKYNRSNEIGDERSQLETEIRCCVGQDNLKEFINSSKNRKEFYEKNSGKKLSSKNINILGKNIDIIREVTERIYDIRCRIVHKKSNEYNDGLILPYSQEIKMLNYDIELIEYVARNILIENSRPINL